jgi:hypothetical protein
MNLSRLLSFFSRQRKAAILCLLLCAALPMSYADTTPLDEYKIKAGYLFNFTKFITWSQINSPTFNICLLGDDPFGELINPIEQHTAFNLPIRLFRLNATNKDTHCHIVYVGAGANVKSIKTSNTLTVGEDSKFINQGGMIAFVAQDDKIKLQINLKLAQQSGLKISAKLLEVSTIVGGEIVE